MGAGKSTAARLLAERWQRGVHVEGDVFRRSIVSGRQELTPLPTPEAFAQLRLRYRLSAAAADAYAEAGFNVVVEDVIAGPLLIEVAAMISSAPAQVVVLLPTAATIASRDAARGTPAYTMWEIQQLYGVFAFGTARVGHWLDTSRQTPEETVDEILGRLQ
jgi:chloramphenicol 3-O-phosphotransferase